MDKCKIEECLREYFSDEYVVKVLTRFVDEFQMCFGEIIPIELIIERLKINLANGIEVVDDYFETENGKEDARFSGSGKKVFLVKELTENEEYCAYILFHELLHAVTSEYFDENNMMGFYNITNKRGCWINEAMIEYMTQKRNRMLGLFENRYISGYRTITETMSHITGVLGEKNLVEHLFYKPHMLPELFKENNMDFKALDMAFYRLVGKDDEVFRLGNKKILSFNGNYELWMNARDILCNISNAIGPVKSVEDFRRKYSIINSSRDKEVNLKDIIAYEYYLMINADLSVLLEMGYSQNEITAVLNELNISISNLKVAKEMTAVLGLNLDRTQKAINLSEYISRNKDAYEEFAYSNYGYLYSIFSEGLYVPDKSLYDIYKYTQLGVFLKSHPEYDYNELNITRLFLSPPMIVYIFIASDGKRFLSVLDGGSVVKSSENEFFINYDTDIGYFKIIFDDNGNISWKGTLKKGIDSNLSLSLDYSENSQLSDLEYAINNDNTDESVRKKLEQVKKKIASRRVTRLIDE